MLFGFHFWEKKKKKKKKKKKSLFKPVVLNLGSIEPQGFVESVSEVRQRSRYLRLFSTICKNIHPQTFANMFFL